MLGAGAGQGVAYGVVLVLVSADCGRFWRQAVAAVLTPERGCCQLAARTLKIGRWCRVLMLVIMVRKLCIVLDMFQPLRMVPVKLGNCAVCAHMFARIFHSHAPHHMPLLASIFVRTYRILRATSYCFDRAVHKLQ